MKGIIYCRVSSKEQIEGTSLDSQRLACEEYARAKQIEIAKVFIERGESAKFADRTQLLELIDFCRERKGTINTLLVWKVDRFARNVADHFSIKATLTKYGVRIVSVTEPIDSKPEGKLMETILAGFAQFDNDIRTMRSVQGMRRKVQEGIFPWRAPLGYKSPKLGRGRKTQPDTPDEPLFGLLRKVWLEFATGNYIKADIKRLMDLWGITTKRGKPLSNQSIDKIFQNVYYSGVIVDPWSGEEHKGLHVPMVSPEQFAHVQHIISRRGRSIPHQKYRAEFSLRGFARCPECLGYLTGSFSRGRTKTYAYYHCHNLHCLQRGKGISATDLDNEFMTFLLGISCRPEVIERVQNGLVARTEQRRLAIESARARRKAAADRLGRQLQELIRMRTQQLIEDEEFGAQRKTILEQRHAALGERTPATVPTADLANTLRRVSRPLDSPYTVWQDLPISVRTRFQRSILPVGFPAGKVRTAERGLIFRLEEVFADEDYTNVTLDDLHWNQIEKEIIELSEVLDGYLDEDDALSVAV